MLSKRIVNRKVCAFCEYSGFRMILNVLVSVHGVHWTSGLSCQWDKGLVPRLASDKRNMTKSETRVAHPPLSPLMKGIYLDTNKTVVELTPATLRSLISRLEECAEVTYFAENLFLTIYGEGDCFDYTISTQYTVNGTSM